MNWKGFQKSVPSLPIIENVDRKGVTVMTFKTDDPKVTIVWLFEEESNLQEK